MSKSLLLPHAFKTAGWILFIPASILGLLVLFGSFEFPFLETKVFSLTPEFSFDSNETSTHYLRTNLTQTLSGVLFVISCLFIGFSKEKMEDEYIDKLRLRALLWAVLINYGILLLAFLVVYDVSFLNVMLFNIFTTLLLFILRFHYLLYRSQQALAYEK